MDGYQSVTHLAHDRHDLFLFLNIGTSDQCLVQMAQLLCYDKHYCLALLWDHLGAYPPHPLVSSLCTLPLVIIWCDLLNLLSVVPLVP